MISKLFFTNPSKVHPGPCTHVFLSTANTSLGRSEIFDLVLASKALLWVGQQDNSSSNKVYLPSDAAGFWPKIFIFTRCVFLHLGYSLSLASQPYPIWKPWGSARCLCTRCIVGTNLLVRGLPSLFSSFWYFWRWLWNGMRKIDCLPCASWGAPLVSEGVRFSWQEFNFSRGYNGDLDPVIPLWQGLRL